MKPRNIAIACGVAGVAVGLAAATGIVYHTVSYTHLTLPTIA